MTQIFDLTSKVCHDSVVTVLLICYSSFRKFIFCIILLLLLLLLLLLQLGIVITIDSSSKLS